MLQAERFWGAAWWYNPPRWGTTDGIVPYRVFWVYWRAMGSLMAFERLSTARAALLASPRENPQMAFDREVELAFPPGEE